jgi:hypothetical protein
VTTYIRVPSAVPCLLAAGHGFVDDPIFASVVTRTGHRRKRRLYTRAQRTYRVSRHLSGAAALAFHGWFENTLRAGERSFIERVKTEEGIRFYEAFWLEPPSFEGIPTPRGTEWHLTGDLLVSGDPMETAPATGALSAAYGLALEAEGTIIGVALLVAAYSLALERVLGLEAAYSLELIGPENLQREDGSDFEREDDSGPIERE